MNINFVKLLDKNYKFNIGSVYDSKNVDVEIKFFKNYKSLQCNNNYLFVSGEPLQDEKIKNVKVEVALSPGGANISQENYEKIVESKKDDSNFINIFLDSFDWYLVVNRNVDKQCEEIIEILEQAGYEEREFDIYAGCSLCPCSPGFKLPSSKQLKNVAIFINFKSIA